MRLISDRPSPSAPAPEEARPPARPGSLRLRHFVAVFGPGLVVMLADTDVGSVVTAGQSGVQWGYRLLLLQVLLMPILYLVQELTVRLAIFTGRGHGELILEQFGRFWAWVSAIGLGLAVVGALLTEFAGVAGVGELFGISRLYTLPVAAVMLLAVVTTGSYRRVERVAILVGLLELAFFGVAIAARPDWHTLAAGSVSIPITDQSYLFLVAANIGAVIMPWMIFYQQSAIADKRLGPEHFTAARWDTAIGAVLTQLVMGAVLIACAATIGASKPDSSLQTVGDMSAALTPFLGPTFGRIVFGAGVLGAGLVAAIVASLGFAWGLGEITGYRRSLEYRPLQARWFYGVYALCLIGGAVLVATWPNLVQLNVDVQVMNAMLLPLVLGFLIALSVRALPPSIRPRGLYLWTVVAIAAVTTAFGVFGAVQGVGLL